MQKQFKTIADTHRKIPYMMKDSFAIITIVFLAWTKVTLTLAVANCSSTQHSPTMQNKQLYSTEENGIRPMIPKGINPEYISHNVFTDSGQYDHELGVHQLHKEMLSTEFNSLEDMIIEYIQNFFNKGHYKPLPRLIIEYKSNQTVSHDIKSLCETRHAGSQDGGNIRINLPRALQSGRLFLTGLKKILWPIFVGLQILKSLLFAMLLPSLIGSFGKLLGKGIASASIRPMEAPQDLDFRDNSFNFDEDSNKFIINDGSSKDGGYAYSQPEASQTQYTYNTASINNHALSRYGVNEKQLNKIPDSYLNALQSISSASFKNSNSISGSSSQGGSGGVLPATPIRAKATAANLNKFQIFQNVPASSLLLSNYDPFYSPLLSRLDSVFAQLKLNSENEMCREKLICLMYSNPAKYAPFSNLVSAQLSRELNELRKPTSDNPDILRFFKYMRAAKDGQDGVDCEASFDQCKEFKDFENPAMVSTYHDINKLVRARKMIY